MTNSTPRYALMSQISSCLFLATLIALLTGCSSAYKIERTSTASYPPVTHVEILQKKPIRAFTVLGSFVGREREECPQDQPYCELRKQAQQLGAHAIWIQDKSVYRQPGEWKMIEGKLTQIRAFTIETLKGEFLRYE